ncbi:hypothetical protein A7U58_08450 [Burkholderia pseudomallei]|nr:hypothetical protein A7U58_08450 [Burkholderia pseudomallei]ANW56104.1 hypothetical protein A7U59_08435 [Burkholderia pseudomallei]
MWQHFRRGTSAKLLLLRMAGLCNDSGNLSASITTLAHDCCVSKAQARRIVHSLIDDGYLELVSCTPGMVRHYRVRLERLKRDTTNGYPASIANAVSQETGDR